MTEDKLHKHIRLYYDSQNLPPEALERLKESIAQKENEPKPHRRALIRWSGIAATVLIAAMLGLWVSRPSDPERRMRRDIAEQAARDHHLRLGVELEAAAYSDVRAGMNKLEFSPVEPDSLKGMRMRLLGARYSSIQGQSAVAMKLVDQRGEVCTLIQARPVDQLAGLQERTIHQVDGLMIDIWSEKGLIMVLTRPIA